MGSEVINALIKIQVLVAYNVSNKPRNDCIIVDATFHSDGGNMKYLYVGSGTVAIQKMGDQARFVQLNLAPYQFVILQ